MARRVHYKRNPELGGHNVVDLGWEAGGLAATALVNDKLVQPLARNFLPALFVGSGVMAKAADAVTTFLSATVLRMGIGFVDRSVANKAARGGYVLTAGKGISVLFPTFSISGNLPISLPSFSLNGGNNGRKELPAGTSADQTITRLGVRSMGL